jgi:hypothetical protein
MGRTRAARAPLADVQNTTGAMSTPPDARKSAVKVSACAPKVAALLEELELEGERTTRVEHECCWEHTPGEQLPARRGHGQAPRPMEPFASNGDRRRCSDPAPCPQTCDLTSASCPCVVWVLSRGNAGITHASQCSMARWLTSCKRDGCCDSLGVCVCVWLTLADFMRWMPSDRDQHRRFQSG